MRQPFPLQWPESFTRTRGHNRQKSRGLGGAVPPPVAELVVRRVVDAMFTTSEAAPPNVGALVV